MRVHLAGYINAGMREDEGLSIGMDAVLEHSHRHHLQTFAYPTAIKPWGKLWQRLPGCICIIDSGAFSADNASFVASPRTYARFIDAFLDVHGPQLRETHFMSLDVIGDQAASWANFEFLRRRGKPVMPVLTTGSTEADTERALGADEHPYIAVGGVHDMPRGDPRIDAIFRVVHRHADRTGRFPRVHLLGVAKKAILVRYPAFSSDASTWLRPLRYGYTKALRMHRMPAYKLSPEAYKAQRLAITREVGLVVRLEHEMTRLWTHRGITFEEDA